MKIDLSGKTAIVTGSTKGIGLATAKGLAQAGASVIINGRSQAAIDQAIATILHAAPGATITGVVADLSTAQGCHAFVREAPECDILINNLGVFGPQDFFETPDSEWDRFFQVNVMSGVRLSRAYLAAMEFKAWGRVIFVSSESAFNIPADMVHYGMTKTAQLAVARGIAKRMAGTGVTVNSVLPGPTLSDGMTDMLAAEVARTGQPIETVAKNFVMANRSTSIIQRAAKPEEVASMIVYLCSPQASATTGAALRVDGGIIDTI